uniref:Uncharacterized protein n=1 Tax=Rhodocyclus tenuis TaxID=1066 RepID=A0A840G1Q5_RHOTE|nr:hypothetical protein [Rhodocyclus tenuis]
MTEQLPQGLRVDEVFSFERQHHATKLEVVADKEQ